MFKNVIKLHYMNAFTRGLMINTGLLLATSLFLTSIGGTHYPSLYLYANLATITTYLFFILFTVTGSLRIYLSMLIAAFALSLGLWYNHQQTNIIWIFAAGILVLDISSPTLAGDLLQATVNSSIFKRVYQNLVSVEVVTRLLSAVLVWGFSRFYKVEDTLVIFWVAMLVHMLCVVKLYPFLKTHAPVEGLEKIVEVGKSSSLDIKQRLGKVFASFDFLSKNQLTKAALFIAIWTYVIKFFADTLFNQSVSENFSHVDDAAQFISQITFGSLILTLVTKKLLSDKLLETRKLSSLLAVLPIFVACFVAAALVFKGMWPVVALVVSFSVINRCIQLPVSRQCLLPVPDSQKHYLVVLIYLLTTVVTLMVSSVFSFAHDTFTTDHYLLALSVITAIGFVSLLHIDNHYVENLWRHYQEKRLGTWQNDLWTTPSLELRNSIKGFREIYNDRYWLLQQSEHLDANISQRGRLVNGYLSNDEALLRAAVAEHQRMLASENYREVLLGIAVVGELSMPRLEPALRLLTSHSHPAVRNLANKELTLANILNDLRMDGLRGHTKRKLRAILRQQLLRNENAVQRRLPTIKKVLQLEDRKIVAKMIDLFNYHRRPKDVALLWKCLRTGVFNIEPLIAQMLKLEYVDAQSHRNILMLLDPPDSSLLVVKNYIEVVFENFFAASNNFEHILNVKKASPMREKILHALFLEEWSLRGSAAVDAVIDSISDLVKVSKDELHTLMEMHQEILKGSPQAHQHMWQQIMG